MWLFQFVQFVVFVFLGLHSRKLTATKTFQQKCPEKGVGPLLFVSKLPRSANMI